MSLYASLGIKPFAISPHNHGSNSTERYIRTMNDMIWKYCTDTGDKWPLFVYPCCYAMNTFVSPTTVYSPFEVVFLGKPPDITEFNFDPNTDGLSLEATEYMKLMKDRFHLMRKIVLDRKIRDQETRYIKELRKNPD